MFREALAIDRQRLGNDHPEVAIKLVNLSRLLVDQGRPEAAESPARDAVAIRRKVLGNDHPALTNALDQLANTLEARNPRETEQHRREALSIARRAYGEAHRETARLENNLAWTLFRRGAYAEAALLSALGHRDIPKTVGADHALTKGSLGGLAFALNGLHDFRGAEAAAREALAAISQAASGSSGCHRAHGARQRARRTAPLRGGGRPAAGGARHLRENTLRCEHPGTSPSRKAASAPRSPAPGIALKRNGCCLPGMKACAPCRRRRRCRSAARPSGSWRSTLPQAGADDAAAWRNRLQGMAAANR